MPSVFFERRLSSRFPIPSLRRARPFLIESFELFLCFVVFGGEVCIVARIHAHLRGVHLDRRFEAADLHFHMAELFPFYGRDFLLLLVFLLRRSLIFLRLFFYSLFPAAVFFKGFEVELFLFIVAVVSEVLGELSMFHFYDAGRDLI